MQGFVRKTESLSDKLFHTDDFHPSPLGTWLQCCVLYCIIAGGLPPRYDASWWETSRHMPDDYVLPTEEEAEEIRQVVIDMCDSW